jgi:ribosomal protein L21E
MAKAVINLQKESGGIVKISSVDGTGVTEVTVPERGNLVSVDTAVTDNAVVRFNGTTGQVQNSSVVIDDNGYLSISSSIPLPSTAGSKITAFSKDTNVGSGNVSFLRFDTVRTSAGSTHTSSEERIRKVVDATEMGYIGFGQNTVKLGNMYGDKVIIDVNGNVLVTSPAGLGYGAGAGGTVTQLTSKSTEVTLNKPSGTIIMNNAALAAGAIVGFTFVNNLLSTSGDNLLLTINNPISGFNYKVEVAGMLGGIGAQIKVTNVSGSTLSDALSLNFAVIKGANS